MINSGGGGAQVPLRQTEPTQQSLLVAHTPPCVTHGPTVLCAVQWRVGGSVTGESSLHTDVLGLLSAPQQSSSTSQLLALAVPLVLQPSSTQKPRSFK